MMNCGVWTLKRRNNIIGKTDQLRENGGVKEDLGNPSKLMDSCNMNHRIHSQKQCRMRKGTCIIHQIQGSDHFWGERERDRVGDKYSLDFISIMFYF